MLHLEGSWKFVKLEPNIFALLLLQVEKDAT